MQWQPRNGKDDQRGRYKQVQTGKKKLAVGRVALAAVFLFLAVFGLIKLIQYAADWISSRNATRDVRELYYNAPTDVPTQPPAPLSPTATLAPTDRATLTPAPEKTPEPTKEQQPATEAPTPEPKEKTAEPASAATDGAVALPTPAITLAPTDGPAYTPGPTQSPIPKLDALPYPDNENNQVNSRFKALQRENKDIVGWLNIDRLVDEPVMQRDNVYYLDHDVNGKLNVNGSIFLDASADLSTRPYSLVVYGHNMKSGAMFGSLRNFENITYYHRSPFITLDTMYEDGRYVIFAVGTINVEQEGEDFVDFFDLYSTAVEGRRNTIDTMKECSVHTCTVDVNPDDQLLVLVTCVEDDNERRIVAARRVRDDETESALRKVVQQSRKK